MSLQGVHHAVTSGMGDHTPVVTYTAGVTAVLFWGLHLSDIAVILSTLATIAGVALQFYVALHRIRVLERAQVAQTITSAGQSTKIAAVEERQGALAQDAQIALLSESLEGKREPQ